MAAAAPMRTSTPAAAACSVRTRSSLARPMAPVWNCESSTSPAGNRNAAPANGKLAPTMASCSGRSAASRVFSSPPVSPTPKPNVSSGGRRS
jgi:hypothetical protein